MIGVDLDTDWRNLWKILAGDNADRRCGLGEKERNASVHDAEILMHLLRYGHRQTDVLAGRKLDLDAEKPKQLVLSGLFQHFLLVHGCSSVPVFENSGCP